MDSQIYRALSRRRLLTVSAAAAAAATVPLGAGPAAAADGGAVGRAYHYLDTVMDAYATGTERRVPGLVPCPHR